MAGKSWQPSHEFPCSREIGTHHTEKGRGGEGEGDHSLLKLLAWLTNAQQYSLLLLTMPCIPRLYAEEGYLYSIMNHAHFANSLIKNHLIYLQLPMNRKEENGTVTQSASEATFFCV